MHTVEINLARFTLLAIYISWATPNYLKAAELSQAPLTWGVRIHAGNQVITIPSVATSADLIGAMTVLPPTKSATQGILVCRVGGRWSSKRLGPASNPDREDPDCVLFVNLDTGSYRRYTGLQPAPDFVVQSPDGKYFALGSSVGWSFTKTSLADLIDSEGVKTTTLRGSGLKLVNVRRKLMSAFTGTIQYSIWDAETLRPIWEMRYPNEIEGASDPRFQRPWGNTGRIPIPWWAINEEPILYNYPTMSFSPDNRFFVALSEKYGVCILNIATGQQTMLFQPTEDISARNFLFRDCNTIEVMTSDGASHHVSLHDMRKLNDTCGNTLFTSIPTASTDLGVYPLFCSDASRQWIATLTDNELRISKSRKPSSGRPIVLSGCLKSIGVSRLEISRCKSWAGVKIERSRETIEHLRFRDSGVMNRFERIDLRTGRVVERIVNSRSFKKTDDVPTINLASQLNIRSFGACLNANGDGIVYATPFCSTRNDETKKR